MYITISFVGKEMHYQHIKLSKFVAIIMVISKSRPSVIKEDTELLVDGHITIALGCTTSAVYQQILSWL